MTFGLALSGIGPGWNAVPYNFRMDRTNLEPRIEISWAACPRWATSGSSDLIDTVEQLGHEWAIVMIDVQGSGLGGRRLAGTLMRMTRECLAAGMAPSTSVLAVHQHLFTLRQAKVGASIHVCVVDAMARRASISGLGPLSIAFSRGRSWDVDCFVAPGAGFERDVAVESRPWEFAPNQRLVLANDGIARQNDDLASLLSSPGATDNQYLNARQILEHAIRRDSGRPRSDMAIALIAYEDAAPDGRILHAHMSIPVKFVRRDS